MLVAPVRANQRRGADGAVTAAPPRLRHRPEIRSGRSHNGAGMERSARLAGRNSRSRALQGFTPSETGSFIFSLKEPLFTLLRDEVKGAQQGLYRARHVHRKLASHIRILRKSGAGYAAPPDLRNCSVSAGRCPYGRLSIACWRGPLAP